MKKKAEKEQKTYSYEEYRKKFYPLSAQEQQEKTDNPFQLGVNWAKESLKKVAAAQ